MQKVIQLIRAELRLQPELRESRAQNLLAAFLLHMKSLRAALLMKVSQSRLLIIIP